MGVIAKDPTAGPSGKQPYSGAGDGGPITANDTDQLAYVSCLVTCSVAGLLMVTQEDAYQRYLALHPELDGTKADDALTASTAVKKTLRFLADYPHNRRIRQIWSTGSDAGVKAGTIEAES